MRHDLYLQQTLSLHRISYRDSIYLVLTSRARQDLLPESFIFFIG